MTAKKVTKGYDLAKLQKMRDPISVRVDKRRGSVMQSVSLPGKEGAAPGTNWSRDDVPALELLVRDRLSGGGYYSAKVADSDGTSMEWEFGWDPNMYPEIVPPDAPLQQPQPQPQPTQVNAMNAGNPLGTGGGNWLSGFGTPVAQFQSQPQVQPQPSALPWSNPWQQAMTGFPHGFGQPVQTSDRRDEDRIRGLEDRLREASQQNLQGTYQAQLDRQRQDGAQQIAALKEEIRRLGEKGSSTETAEFRAQREENQRLQRQQELEALRNGFQQQIMTMQQESKDNMRALQDMVKEMAQNKGEPDAMRQLREEMQRDRDRAERDRQEQRHRDEIQELRASLNKGPDPMIEFLRENSRTTENVARENAQAQTAIAERISQSMISPLQLSEMLQRQSTGMDSMLQNVINIMGSGFETYRAMMESILQASGGGQSPGIDMLQQGMGSLSEIANQYLGFQRDKAVHEASAKAAGAQAQAEAAKAAQAQASAWQQQQQGAPPPQQQLQPEQASEAMGDSGNGQTGEAKPAEVIDINERRAPTEQEVFGPALEAVHHLRLGVTNGTMDPEGAVAAILQGISVAAERGLEIPAFAVLAEGRFADLMDLLLPEADQEFRDKCAQIIEIQIRSMSQGGAPAEPPEPSPTA
jgi:hypothetical protein